MSLAQPLRLELRPSRRLAAVILAVHATASASFLTTLTAWPGLSLAVLTMALGCAAAWDRALLRSGRSPRLIEISPAGDARCQFADGESAPLRPLGGSAVTRYWVALRLLSARRRSLFVAAGMLPADALRQLRLWALWGRLPSAAARRLPA